MMSVYLDFLELSKSDQRKFLRKLKLIHKKKNKTRRKKK
jgi:hypothetical protein